MVGLQQIHAVFANQGVDAADVVGTVEPLADDGIHYRFAGAVRHGAGPTGDRDQRRCLAFAPADVIAGTNSNQQNILAAVAHVVDNRHGKVEKINGFDFHVEVLYSYNVRKLPG